MTTRIDKLFAMLSIRHGISTTPNQPFLGILMQISVKLMGSLKPHQPDGPLSISSDLTIAEVIDQLGVTATAVQVCTVNGKIEHNRQRPVADGDELTLLPPVGGG